MLARRVLLGTACLASALATALPARAALDAAWRIVPLSTPADSLPFVLRRLEVRGAPGVRPGEAAYALGQYRYARGEYAAAADAFLRAYARLDGADREAARYARALADLALGQAAAARDLFEQAAETTPALRAPALWGVACCWEAQGHPEKAWDALQRLLSGDAGEMAPAALERTAALGARFHHEAEARTARERLLREFPRSVEAARVAATAPTRPGLDRPASGARLPAP